MNSNKYSSKFEFSPDLAEICGIHAGDGYLRNKDYKRELDISGGVDEKEYYDCHVVPLFEKVFNINIKPKFFPQRHTYGFVIRDKEIIEFMHSLGFPYGKKTFIVKVPDFVLDSRSLDIIYRFIRGVFDTDGCLTFGKRAGGGYRPELKIKHYYPVISLSICSEPLCSDVKSLFDKTGFNCRSRIQKTKAKNESDKYQLYLRGVPNLENWINNIGFKNTSKFSRYKIWKKFGFCPTNLTFEQRRQILNNELDPNMFYQRAYSSVDGAGAFGAQGRGFESL